MLECVDYDGMGNHGRFPKRKESETSLMTKFINSIKRFYAKRR
jgi:hypothetical protein